MAVLRTILAGLVLIAQPDVVVSPTAGPALPAGDRPALLAAARDLCGKRMVLLGEAGTHGDGHTAAFKVALVRHLLTRCGFDAIVFESSRSEFIAAERALRQGTATQVTIADALGALWKYDREVQPLIDLLFDRARAGRLRLAGIDSRIGGLGERYANESMVPELTRGLAPARAADGTRAFADHVAWRYPAKHPYGPVEHDRLLACAAAMRHALDRDSGVDGVTRAERLAMIDNLGWAITPDLLPRAGQSAARERSMFRNAVAFAATLPKDAKVIVWGATVHLAKGGDDPTIGAMLHDRYPGRAFTLGFSATGGRYRMFRQIMPLPEPPPGAIERTVPLPEGAEAVYVDLRRLPTLGAIPGGAIDRRYPVTDWAGRLDGMVLFRHEWPTHSTRPGFD